MEKTKSLSTKYRYKNIFPPKQGESDPRVWGPAKWGQMFNTAAIYPKKNPTENQKLTTYKYFKNLDLPCVQCHESYVLFWNQLPIEDYLSSRSLLIEWVYIIKKKVNSKLMRREKNNEARFTQQCLQQKPNQMDFCVNYGKELQGFRTTPSPPLQTIVNRYFNLYD